MKKALSVFLALLLAISSIFSVLFIPTAAEIDPSTITNDFEDESKWTIYDYSVSYVNSTAKLADSWAKILENTDVNYIYEGETSLKFACQWQVPAYVMAVEKNTDYTFSFKYLDPSVSASSPLSRAGVINNNYNTSWENAADEAFYALIDSYTAYTSSGSFSERESNWDLNVNTNYKAGEWNEIVLNFNSGDNETVTFTPIFTVSTVYVDDIKLLADGEATTPTPEPEPEPEPTTSEASKWQVYIKGSYTSLDGTATNREGWNSVSDNTDSAFNCGDIASVKYYGSHATVARPLGLESGKKYKISFKYYVPDSTVPSESGESLFYQLGIVAKGTAIGSNGRPTAATLGGDAMGTKNTWNEYSMELENKDATEKFLYFFGVFSAGYTVYLADVKTEVIGTITEPEPTPDPDPEPKPDPEPSDSEATKWQVYLNSTHATIDGTATNREGWNSVSDNTDSAFNYEATPTLKFYGSHSTVARLLEGMEAMKSYKISFKYYMPASTVPYGSGSMLYQSGIVGKDTAITSGGGSYPMTSLKYGDPYVGEFDKWNEYSIIYTNWDDAEEYFYFCPVFNAGYTFYFADFKVEEAYVENPGLPPFNGWGDEPKEEYLINFDDFDIPFTESYVEVVEGPERDSKASNTLHVIGGEYDYAVFPKWGTVTSHTDPFFTLPVKENALYEYSFWIYIHEDAGLISWLQFYYDYANSGYILLNKTEDKGKWVKYTARFITKAGQDKISLGFNASNNPYDMWIDDFCVKEITPGVLGDIGSAGYCEDMLNMLNTDGIAASVLKGKTATLKVPVEISTQYTFGVDIASSKVSASRIFLSYDGKTPIKGSDEGSPDAVIKSNGKSGRYSFNFVTSTSGYIYIVIENDDNALSFSEPMLFNSYTLSTGRLVESETPIDRQLSVNKGKDTLQKISTSDGVIAEDNASDDQYTESPKTGDSALPLTLLIITFIAATALLAVTKKGGEQA